MRKIKLVVSDLHISKGRTLEDGSPNLLEDFYYDREFIDFLGWFSSEEYRKYDVEIIFNGDFLNTLQVDLRESFPEIITENMAVEKVKSIIRGHPELFEALKSFAATPNHEITVITGNHDPAFLWPTVRDFFASFLETEVRYPLTQYRFDGFHIEHGNQHTVVNAYETKKLFLHDGLDEPILNLPFGSLFVIKFLNKVKQRRGYADKVRPLRKYLMGSLLNDPLFGWPSVFRLAWFLIASRLRKKYLTGPEMLKTWKILVEGFRFTPDLENAARKVLFANPDVHTVLMGHTHRAMHRRFRADKEYFNTGTWNDTIYLDIENLGRSRKLTFAMIEYNDKDRPRAKLMEWRGLARPFLQVEY